MDPSLRKYLAFAALALTILWELHQLFDSVQYFSRAPGELIYVAGSALSVGAVLVIYHQLTLAWQWRMQLLLLGSVATGLTLVLTHISLSFVKNILSTTLSYAGYAPTALLLPLVSFAFVTLETYFAVKAWRLFWRVLKHGRLTSETFFKAV